ncbi:hypothetical protein [Bartonella sp. OT172YNZD]|uniref:hypothetical protein n=1 Tax=Bartonella sp. OT172YNZD TaxID=3243572 RepID=UPI0035D11642
MVTETEAEECYDAVEIGLDLTAWDLQTKLKEKSFLGFYRKDLKEPHTSLTS